MEQTKECIRRIRPYVDRAVIIVDETVTEESKKWLRDHNCEVYFHPWEDSMVKMRNQYLQKCQHGDWIVVSDPDEWFCEEFCKDLRKIIEDAERNGIGLLLINSHDILIKEDGTKEESVSDFFKNLIFKYEEGVRYEGVGEVKEVHEELKLPPGTKVAALPKRYYYEHVKYWHEVWERAARNVFIAGGGNNVGTRNKAWPKLRQICYELGLDTWPKAREYFRRGNIDPRLKEWLWENRQDGWDYEHEMMEFGRWYFEYLHPEEAKFPDGRVWKPIFELKPGSPQEVMRYVEQCYLEVLGRHADDEGKQAYTRAILEGRIRREDLPEILRRSPEYRMRFPEKFKEEKRVKLQVPVDVNVRVSEDMFVQALMRSGTYWQKIKPMLNLAKKLEAYLAIQKKAETGGRGVDEEPVETFQHYVEKIKQIMPPDKYPYILEIGAGAGSETKALMDAGYKVTGITFGKDNIRYAKENYDIDLIEMDMHNLELPEGIFDGVVMIHTFEHALAPHMVVGEIRYVLKDGGRVYLVVPDIKEQTIWHTNLLYPDQIVAMFKFWGFKDLKQTELKSRSGGDKWEFAFEKLPSNHPDFQHNWGYIQHIYKRRAELYADNNDLHRMS